MQTRSGKVDGVCYLSILCTVVNVSLIVRAAKTTSLCVVASTSGEEPRLDIATWLAKRKCWPNLCARRKGSPEPHDGCLHLIRAVFIIHANRSYVDPIVRLSSARGSAANDIMGRKAPTIDDTQIPVG